MLRSLYDFTPTYAKTLGFKENDYFILHSTITKHKNWWEVMNEIGEIGYVPSNYVEEVAASPAFYLQFVDKCIDSVKRNQSSRELPASLNKKELLNRLRQMKINVEQMPAVAYHSIAGDDGPPLLFKNSEGQLKTIKSTVSNCSSNSSSLSSEYKKCNVFDDTMQPLPEIDNSNESLKLSMDNPHMHLRDESQKRSIIVYIRFRNLT